MRTLSHLFENNRAWAARMRQQDPHFFGRLAAQQTPEILWIGCSDSRVPANVIVDLPPGEIFVHRNIANLALPTDLNCLSVLHYAVEVLRVGHVVVCGHYGCGGVLAALQGARLGLVEHWLRHVEEVRDRHRAELDSLPDETARHRRLCELNVVAQVENVCRSPVVRRAWERGQPLSVHGWIYRIEDGLLQDLDVCVSSAEEAETWLAARVPSLP
jgi:carbonic anhydrase